MGTKLWLTMKQANQNSRFKSSIYIEKFYSLTKMEGIKSESRGEKLQYLQYL